jgi:hypothetical protein
MLHLGPIDRRSPEQPPLMTERMTEEVPVGSEDGGE